MKKEIITVVKAYVSNCYESDAPDFMVYHNLSHTEVVVTHCQQLADHYSIAKNEKDYLQIAAWFHDIGYLYTIPERHEEKSVEIMRSFLTNDYSSTELSFIENIILATKISTRPASLLESIIRDADTYHFGTKQFFAIDILVRREMELLTGRSFPKWKDHSLELLKSHQFHTSYCKEHLDTGKRENISILES